MILTGQTGRSRVRFEVLPCGEADLVKLLSLSSSETSGLLLWSWRTPEVPHLKWGKVKVSKQLSSEMKNCE